MKGSNLFLRISWNIGHIGLMGKLHCSKLFVRRKSFVFQAENGIRGLVRSRGIGDVYKRRGSSWPPGQAATAGQAVGRRRRSTTLAAGTRGPVSYTLLTLSTILRVFIFIYLHLLILFDLLHSSLHHTSLVR